MEEWNLDKIAAHGLSAEDVEYAYEHRLGRHNEREDGAHETVGRTASGRLIMMVWKYDEEFDALSTDYMIEVVFVITAY